MIAGLDISTRAVHIVSLPEDSNDALLHVVRVDTQRGLAIDRIRRLRDKMPARTAWRDAGCTLIAIERPYSLHAATLAPMMAVYGALLQLFPSDLPLLELSASDWRKECALPQRGADVKPAAVRFARQCWTNQPAAIDEDTADAFCISFAAREIDLRRERAA